MDFFLLTDKRCTNCRAKGRHRQSSRARLTQQGSLGQGRHPTPSKAVRVGSPRGRWEQDFGARLMSRCQLAILGHCLMCPLG